MIALHTFECQLWVVRTGVHARWRGLKSLGEERSREGSGGVEGRERGGAWDKSSRRVRYMLTKSVSLAHMRSTLKLIGDSFTAAGPWRTTHVDDMCNMLSLHVNLASPSCPIPSKHA